MHSESLPFFPNTHEVQPELPGAAAQAEVPRGGLNLVDMKFHAVPPKARTSTSESFSSVSTRMATSESGRKKSARCERIVVSTPTHCANFPDWSRPSDPYGSGWMRKRYQDSSCDSMPQPNWWTPATSY